MSLLSSSRMGARRVQAPPPWQQRRQLASPPPASWRNNSRQPLRFYASGVGLAQPSKESDGEDAHLISECGSALGVADGVGGWTEVGIDAGLYSRQLIEGAKRYVADTGSTCPHGMIKAAYDSTSAEGSATICCATLSGRSFRASNVGDSGFVVFRPEGGRLCVVKRSSEQVHYFNCPRQLGTNSADVPSDADHYYMEVQEGDIVIMGTDGLFDNLSIAEIAAELEDPRLPLSIDANKLTLVARHLADVAMEASLDGKRLTPFTHGARQAGLNYDGGKPDDITVVIAIVGPRLGPVARPRQRAESPNPAKDFYLPPSTFSAMDTSDEDTAVPRSPDDATDSEAVPPTPSTCGEDDFGFAFPRLSESADWSEDEVEAKAQ